VLVLVLNLKNTCCQVHIKLTRNVGFCLYDFNALTVHQKRNSHEATWARHYQKVSSVWTLQVINQ